MSLARFSIRAVLFGILLIAGNLAAFRLFMEGRGDDGLTLGLFSTFPMANIVALAGYRGLTRSTRWRPFLLGFAFSGAVLILVWFNFCLAIDQSRLAAAGNWFAEALENIGISRDRHMYYYVEKETIRYAYPFPTNLSVFALLLTLPQLLVACLAGWIARRFAATQNPTVAGPGRACAD